MARYFDVHPLHPPPRSNPLVVGRLRDDALIAYPTDSGYALGFDEEFRRTWEFYLAYCEAGFRSRYLSVSQLRLTRAPGRLAP
jgi:hypothetical protein